MNDCIGKIVEGEITNITSFGAFVRIPSLNEEGLIHISEIADEYVKDINEFVKIGAKVKIKVLKRNKKNKLELSIKQVSDQGETEKAKTIQDTEEEVSPKAVKPYSHKKHNHPPARKEKSEFEEKLSFFLKRSEEKLIDIRRNLKHKQGISKKRK